VYDLTLEDLGDVPVWEFALDEEGERGQDEQTVRSRAEITCVDPREGVFVVATSFAAASSSEYRGFATAHETSGAGYVQPTIVTETGHVAFWYGSVRGSRRERELQEEIAGAYQALETSPNDLFPLAWKMDVSVRDAPDQGVLSGFGYLLDVRERDADGTRRWRSIEKWRS
jgi:hypothetical protein